MASIVSDTNAHFFWHPDLFTSKRNISFHDQDVQIKSSKKMIQLSYLPVSDKLYYDDLSDPANKFQHSKKKKTMKLICKCEFEKSL